MQQSEKEQIKNRLKRLKESNNDDQYAYIDHVANIIKEFISLKSSLVDDQNDNGISRLVVQDFFGGEWDYEDNYFGNKASALVLLNLLSNESVRSLLRNYEIEEAIKFLTRTVQFCSAIEDFEPYKAILDMSFVNNEGINDLYNVMCMEEDYLIKVKLAKYEKELAKNNPFYKIKGEHLLDLQS